MPARGPHITQLFDLTGRVAMVTGGAQPLGLDMAAALAAAGADLAITSRACAKCAETARSLAEHTGRRVLALELGILAQA